jgi:hypothetical protein
MPTSRQDSDPFGLLAIRSRLDQITEERRLIELMLRALLEVIE